jgi:hypothetical protein
MLASAVLASSTESARRRAVQPVIHHAVEPALWPRAPATPGNARQARRPPTSQSTRWGCNRRRLPRARRGTRAPWRSRRSYGRAGVAVDLDVVAYRSGALLVREDFVGVQRAASRRGRGPHGHTRPCLSTSLLHCSRIARSRRGRSNRRHARRCTSPYCARMRGLDQQQSKPGTRRGPRRLP